MRYVHDHPRVWAELVLSLDVADAHAFRDFARTVGVIVEIAGATLLEDTYHEWRQHEPAPSLLVPIN